MGDIMMVKSRTEDPRQEGGPYSPKGTPLSFRRNMKIILIQPPVQDFYDTDIRLQPYGLCMLKAAVGKFLPHMEVIVRDYHHGFGRRTMSLPSELSYLREYFPYPDSSPFSTFHQYYHFGAPFEAVGEGVAAERPDLVGISSLFSPYYREALACAREIKKRLKVPVILGGSHVSASPLSVLMDPSVDFIVRGEGERPFVEFLTAYQSSSPFEGIPNFGFKKNGMPILTPMEANYPLDQLPFADFRDLGLDRYLFDKRPLCFLTTSRSCPHRCAFCSVHLTFGDEFRVRSEESIIEEMRQRFSEGYRVFDFEDDNLTFQKAAFKGLLKTIIAEFRKGDIRLTAMNGVSFLSLDREMLVSMTDAGFSHLNLSLVSAEERVLRRTRRPHTLSKYLEVVNQAHSLGFETVSYQILGLPYETLEEMIATMSLLASLPVLIGPSVFYLTPGSPLAREFPEPSEADIFRSRATAMAVEARDFRRDDLYTLFTTARIINFLKGLELERQTVTLQDCLEAASALGGRGEQGALLLALLLERKILYAATGHGLKPLSPFKADLFFRVLKGASCIRTLKGNEIDTSDMNPLPRGMRVTG